MIDVLDGSPKAPLAGSAGGEDESGRGMTLVDFLATRSGWEPTERGKRVWAEITLPESGPAIRAAVLRQFFAARTSTKDRPAHQPFALAVG